jgi:hypothetical protein
VTSVTSQYVFTQWRRVSGKEPCTIVDRLASIVQQLPLPPQRQEWPPSLTMLILESLGSLSDCKRKIRGFLGIIEIGKPKTSPCRAEFDSRPCVHPSWFLVEFTVASPEMDKFAGPHGHGCGAPCCPQVAIPWVLLGACTRVLACGLRDNSCEQLEVLHGAILVIVYDIPTMAKQYVYFS